MFKTDGSVHTSGIKNELNTIDFLNCLLYTSDAADD